MKINLPIFVNARRHRVIVLLAAGFGPTSRGAMTRERIVANLPEDDLRKDSPGTFASPRFSRILSLVSA